MDSVEYGDVGANVARYLLFAITGLLILDGFVAVETRVSLSLFSIVVVGTFAMLSTYRFVASGTDRDRTIVAVDARPVRTKRSLIVLGGLLVYGGVLRGYAVGFQSLWFDEAITANAAIALLEGGSPTFPSGYTYWRAFPHTLAVAGSMVLFGTGEAAARLPSVVFGVATIGVTYWLGRAVGGPRVGLLAAALVTFATWEIAWSRQARMYQLFQLLYALSLVLLLRVERTWFEDRRAVIAMVIVGSLATMTHQIGYVLAPIGVAYLGSVAVVSGRLTRRMTVGLFVVAVAFVAALELQGNGVVGTIESIVAADANHLGAYLDWLVTEFHAFFYLGMIGSVLAFYRGAYRPGALLAIGILPATWILGFHTTLFATRYLYFGLPVLFVWAAVTIEHVGGQVSHLMISAVRRLRDRDVNRVWTGDEMPSVSANSLSAAALVALLVLGGGFTAIPQAEYQLGTNAPQPDFERAYEHVNEHREPGDVIVAGWTAPGLYYAGQVDYWLAHDLTGTGADYTFDGEERYAGAEPVRSANELEAAIEAHEGGWIVVDPLAFSRQPPGVRAVIADLDCHEFEEMTVCAW